MLPIFELIAKNFQRIQVGILFFGALLILVYLRNKSTPSQFKNREANRKDLDQLWKRGEDLSQSRLVGKKPQSKPATPPPPPLALPGLRMNGAPHEILGIAENATEAEIMKAYKEAIKRFHPDTIQGAAKDQIQFYQEASARINEAKNLLIKNLQNKNRKN